MLELGNLLFTFNTRLLISATHVSPKCAKCPVPEQIHSKSQSNLIKSAKHPRKSLIAASYPGMVISNAKVNRSNMHVQHTFLHIVVRADDSLRTKISWMHFGRFPFTQNLRNFGNSGNWYSIFPEKFPDFRKRFRNANHSTT